MSVIIIMIGLVTLVGLDQYTKYLAVTHLQTASFPIIKDFFELTYVENRGAAFGMLQNQTVFFILITVVILGFIIYAYKKLPADKKYTPLRVTFVLIMAGAIGNFIDRLLLGYVVDFLYFKWIDFPVFNVADSYVTVGAIALAILLLFVYKEDDFLNPKKEEKA